jgi:mRNA interferase RelE/StbE
MKTVVFTDRTAKDFDALPTQARLAISQALDAYAMKGEGDVAKLKGREGYRVRVGSYRVIFIEDAETITAIYVGRRTTTTY